MPARAPATVVGNDMHLRVVAASDHPAPWAARPGRPGIAYADLRVGEVPVWLLDAARPDSTANAVLVTPHWGPNMRAEPLPVVRRAAAALVAAGATLVAGHSAHVFQGVARRVLYDLGDFVDDYAVDSDLRNDLGLLWLVTIDDRGPRRLEALPLALEHCYTRLATGDDEAWVVRRFRELCARLGTEARHEAGRCVVSLS
jgi:poly-gamma-glutamate synthesis protein (capsule biosynthesis protein)